MGADSGALLWASNRWASLRPGAVPSSLRLPVRDFDRFARSARLVDIGCGLGSDSRTLIQEGFTDVLAIDINAQAIERASRDDAGVRYIVGDATSLPLGTASVEIGVCKAVLNVLSDPPDRRACMEEAARVLRTGANLYVSDFLQNWDLRLYAGRYRRGLALGVDPGTFEATGIGDATYLVHHYTESEVEDLLHLSGFKVLEFRRCHVRTQNDHRIDGFELWAERI